MKQSDFKLNTDYLSLANVANTTHKLTIVGRTVQNLNHVTDTIDLAVPTAAGATADYMLSTDGDNFHFGSRYDIAFDSGIKGEIEMHRISEKILRVIFVAHNTTGSAQSFPSLQLTIKEVLFNAPDMV